MSYRPCDKGTVGCVYLGPHNSCIIGGMPITQLDGQPDMVEHPPHYKQGGIETIEVIEAWGARIQPRQLCQVRQPRGQEGSGGARRGSQEGALLPRSRDRQPREEGNR